MAKLEELLEKHEADVNHFLKECHWIEIDQTFRDLNSRRADEILERPSDFLATVLADNKEAA